MAPGTGKTYHTHMYAVAIIEDRPLEDVTAEPHDAVLERFNKYRQQGLIEFTTFHQSYSYEDFVEGIRPVIQDDDADTNGSIAYHVEAGVFKNFCDKAVTSRFTETLRAETSPADNAFLMNDVPSSGKFLWRGRRTIPSERNV